MSDKAKAAAPKAKAAAGPASPKGAAAPKAAAKAAEPKAAGAPKAAAKAAEPKAAAAPKAAAKAAEPKAAAKAEPKAAAKAAEPKPAAKAAEPKAAAPKPAAKAAAPKPEVKAAPKAKVAKAEVKKEPYKPVLEAGFPVPTPESVVKKRRTADSLKAKAAARSLKARKDGRKERKSIYQRAEKYAAEYRASEKNLIRLKRQAKNSGNFFIAPESKVLFAIRVRGIMRTSPKTTKIMQLLRLRQVHNGVFIRVNKAALILLRLVEPYLTYGEPNLKSIRELIYKRGFGKVNKQRIPLTDNNVVSQTLGKYGVNSVEDVIHEIATCGKHFKEVNNFLWPFKLNSPLGGWVNKGIHFTEGGDAGNREEEINTLIRRMN
jgi:large subunit ribosomal protein L7e